MAVIDTGKGIGKEFLRDQLFHPFSQENPLQSGTGLGLAIVNSIVRSDSVDGKVDVWSSEGLGTEIRVSFEVEAVDDEDDLSSASSTVSTAQNFGQNHTVSLLGFDHTLRGHMLLLDILSSYAAGWHFDVSEPGDIIIINEDGAWLDAPRSDVRPVIVLLSSRSSHILDKRDAFNQAGCYCQILFKPVGPSAFRKALTSAVEFVEERVNPARRESLTPFADASDRPSISRGVSDASADSGASGESNESASTISELTQSHSGGSRLSHAERLPLTRRRSEEVDPILPIRPALAPRGVTYHHAYVNPTLDDKSLPSSPSSTISTISLADGGVMLKSAAADVPRKSKVARVMVVEDNVINRRVLGAFLKKRGFELSEAHDGREGVDLFGSTPSNYWE